jgi:hypothetical protein
MSNKPTISRLCDAQFPHELCLQIETADRVFLFDPNSLIMAAADGWFNGLEGAFLPSEISGEAGFIYHTSDGERAPMALRLSRRELFRLVTLSLTPKEYVSLRTPHGLFHEIHDDFYDDAGTAIQPREFALLDDAGRN